MGGLPRGVTQEEIHDFLKAYGQVSEIRIRSSDRDVFAFATLGDHADVKAAVEDLNDCKFLDTDSVIQVRASVTQRSARDREVHDRAQERRRSGSPVHAIRLEGLPPDLE